LLKGTRLFASLAEEELAQLSGAAADVSLQPEEWLVREGERLDFFVVLEGELELSKEIMGRQMVMARLGRGDFFGEVSTLFGVPSLSSLRAISRCRLVQFGAQPLRELVQGPTSCGATILKTLKERLAESEKHALELPSARVQVVGSQWETDLSDIRAFLRLNRIPYEWIDRERQPGRVPASIDDGPAVVVDGKIRLKQPLTIKKVAEALGMSTDQSRKGTTLWLSAEGPPVLPPQFTGHPRVSLFS
jgi:thioredoxin reductase (NADPH)